MMNIVLPAIINAVTVLVAIFVMNRTMKKQINETIEEVADLFTEKLTNPTVKKAMSVLGKKSGEVRAEKAVMRKFNENLPNVIPSIGIIAEKLDLEPLEMLQLINDPVVGPVIQGFIGSFLQSGEGSLNSQSFIPAAAGKNQKRAFNYNLT